MFGQNGALAQETLESQGLTVQINKIYPDESQSSMVDIGCVLDTEPAAGTTVKAGDTVTLTSAVVLIMVTVYRCRMIPEWRR